MNLLNPPEIADGGYWYVVPAVPDTERGGLTPGEIPGDGWCAWYGAVAGIDYAAVRTPKQSGFFQVAGVSLADVLTGSKPRGRIGGI